jgi:hypothetical protein
LPVKSSGFSIPLALLMRIVECWKMQFGKTEIAMNGGFQVEYAQIK